MGQEGINPVTERGGKAQVLKYVDRAANIDVVEEATDVK